MRRILVVIDFQVDFISGSLGTREAVAIIPNAIEKIKSYDEADVFATMDTHDSYYPNTQESIFLPVIHCVRGTDGWELHPDIKPLIRESNIFFKREFGCIELAYILKRISDKENVEIELIGICTDICVISNALLFKTIMPEAKIYVDSECCSGTTPEKHNAAVDVMRSCQIYIR